MDSPYRQNLFKIIYLFFQLSIHLFVIYLFTYLFIYLFSDTIQETTLKMT